MLPLLCAVGGGDSFSTRKPDPAHLLATLTRAAGTPESALMLGDHRNDVAGGARRRDTGHLRLVGVWFGRHGGWQRGSRP